jgi:hypothetical protein
MGLVASLLTAACVGIGGTGFASACGLWGQPPCGPMTMQTFSNQTFIQRPNMPPTTMQTFGNQTFINTPGRRPVTCTRFGNVTQCN